MYDAVAKKWKVNGKSNEGKPLRRAFAQFIMEPVCFLCQAIMEGRKEEYEKMITVLQIPLTEADRQLTDKHFLKAVMS